MQTPPELDVPIQFIGKEPESNAKNLRLDDEEMLIQTFEGLWGEMQVYVLPLILRCLFKIFLYFVLPVHLKYKHDTETNMFLGMDCFMAA